MRGWEGCPTRGLCLANECSSSPRRLSSLQSRPSLSYRINSCFSEETTQQPGYLIYFSKNVSPYKTQVGTDLPREMAIKTEIITANTIITGLPETQ